MEEGVVGYESIGSVVAGLGTYFTMQFFAFEV